MTAVWAEADGRLLANDRQRRARIGNRQHVKADTNEKATYARSGN